MNKLLFSVLWASALLLTLVACKSRSHYAAEHDDLSGESTREERVITAHERDVEREEERSIRQGTRVHMVHEGGVYYVPIVVDGLPLRFIFDTGASNICISSAEAATLYKQGLLTEDDIKGTERMLDATGNVSVGAVVNLKTVTIGDITLHNVEAIVTENLSAPLLLGQSALSKFGRISIDYENNLIEFN